MSKNLREEVAIELLKILTQETKAELTEMIKQGAPDEAFDRAYGSLTRLAIGLADALVEGLKPTAEDQERVFKRITEQYRGQAYFPRSNAEIGDLLTNEGMYD